MFTWLNKRDRQTLKSIINLERYGIDLYNQTPVVSISVCEFIEWAYSILKKLEK